MTQGKAASVGLILQEACKLLVFALTWNTFACIVLWEINSATLLRVHIIIMESYSLIVVTFLLQHVCICIDPKCSQWLILQLKHVSAQTSTKGPTCQVNYLPHYCCCCFCEVDTSKYIVQKVRTAGCMHNMAFQRHQLFTANGVGVLMERMRTTLIQQTV